MARYRYFNVFAGYVDRVTLIFDLSDVQVVTTWFIAVRYIEIR